MPPVLSLAAEAALADDVPLTIAGLKPCARVAVASVFHDGAGQPWRARGVYAADIDGTVDTARDPSLGGTYRGVDVGGLFWSGLPCAPEAASAWLTDAAAGRARALAPALGPLDETVFTLEVSIDGVPVAEARHRRKRLPDGVTMETVRDGALRGLLFLPADAASPPGLVVLGGSEGGLIPTRAAALAGQGIAALALGYFAYDDRPKAAENLPLEYFAEALDWLARRLGHRRVGIFGSSRGSEAAQLTAAHFPGLARCVVAWAPSHLVHAGLGARDGGLDADAGAMWSLAGKPLPGLGVFGEVVHRDAPGSFLRPPGRRYADDYRDAWLAPDAEARFAIPLERAGCPVLAVSGGADGLWPAALGAAGLVARLKAAGGAHPAIHLDYPAAGHALRVPNGCDPWSHLMLWQGGYFGIDGGFVDYGGSPAGNAAAARDAFAALVRWTREWLG